MQQSDNLTKACSDSAKVPYIDPELPVHPDGATCRDCAHFRRCVAFISREGSEMQGDWLPSAFGWARR